MEQIPDKPFFKVAEVCQYTDTQPYVLRFWESEFPQLKAQKNRSGQRVYTRDDIGLIMKIKHLLYDEEYTLSSAREHLEKEAGARPKKRPAAMKKTTTVKRARKGEDEAEHLERQVAELRDRYEAACREIESLGEQVKAAKAMERSLEVARAEADSLRGRVTDLEKQAPPPASKVRAERDRLRTALKKAEADRDRYRDRGRNVAAKLQKVVAGLESLAGPARKEKQRSS